MLEEPEENRLDQSLRDVFNDYELPLTPPVWAGIEERLAQLPPPVLPVRKRRRPVPLPFLFGLVALLAGLGGWLLPRGGTMASRQGAVRASAPHTGVVAVKGTSAVSEGTLAAAKRTEVASKRTQVAATGTQLGVMGTQVNPTRTHVARIRMQVAATGVQVPAKGIVVAKIRTVVAATRVQAASMGTQVVPTAAGQTRNSGSIAVKNGPAPAAKQETAANAPPAVAQNQPVTASALPDAPAVLRPLLALETTYAAQAKLTLTDPATADRTAVVATLRAERAELLRLQRRADSLLLALGDVPLAAPLAAQLIDTAQARTETPKPDLLTSRWSLLFTAAPEQNTLGLQGRAGDKLTALRRDHETGRSGFSAALMAEYRLNHRVSVGAGLGYSTFGTEFRLTNRRTEVDVTYDTTTNTVLTAGVTTIPTYSIRVVEVPVLTPVFNGSGQVISYDTVYNYRNDTLRTTIVLYDTLRTTTKTITPLLNKREVITSKTFKPQYRFLTLPVQLRYRITVPGTSRWWTDVAAGAQLQFFLGGTQAVTDDGENYRTEKVTVGGGPFRPFNLALSGSLALNYALTNRFSVSVAPSLRWQALSVYKAETGLRQQSTATGLLFGVRWAL